METKAKILAVDDDSTNIAIVKELLEEDYDLRTAATGEEAIEIATDFKPDIILLDIMMPGMDGYEVCQLLRRDPILKYIKIIMVSAKTSTSERLDGYKAGADDYLTKPFDGDELLAKIQVYLRILDISKEVENNCPQSHLYSEKPVEKEIKQANIDNKRDLDELNQKGVTSVDNRSVKHFLCSARSLISNQAYPIGIEIGDDALTLVQLEAGREGINLVHADRAVRPNNIEPQSSASQKWAAHMLRDLIAKGRFKGKQAVVALPSKDVFVDNIVISKVKESTPEDTTFSRILKKLPSTISKDDAIIEYVSPNAKAFVVMVTEKIRVERCLAVCERAKIKLRSLSAWPIALANCYSHFWAKHEDNLKILIDIARDCTRVIICRDAEIYLARSIPIGAQDLEPGSMTEKLVSEIRLCNHLFAGAYQKSFVNNLIFFSSQIKNLEIFRKIASDLSLSAQIADSFEAIRATKPSYETTGKSVFHTNWTAAFGLSLSGKV